MILAKMNAFIFQIISTDSTISCRWQKAFQKEGWLTAIEACCPAEEITQTGPAEIYLIELGIPGCRNQEDLKSVLRTRKPVSSLVFGDPQKVSNSQIAAFLEAGADDFIYKNIDERVLTAKLKAHLRRIMPVIVEAAEKVTSRNGDIEINRNRRMVRLEAREGKYMEISNLTQKEFDILSMLVGHEQKILTRECILEALWGERGADIYSECIDKHIESLRRKLGIYGKRIKTVYGSGYMFTGNNNA